MKVEHRVSLSVGDGERRQLAEIGLEVKGGFTTLVVDEEKEVWPKLAELIEQWGAVDVVTTKFTAAELKQASWFQLVPDWHWGYPQPNEDEFGYRRTTYAPEGVCPSCGGGLVQRAPFQLRGEPKWGKRGILQLNWVFDEYFVTPDVWRRVFEPHGVECRAVHNPQGHSLETVVQLVVNDEVSVNTDGLAGRECRACGRIKYEPATRGYFPAFLSEPNANVAKTKELFGGGAAANKAVLVSKKIAGALKAGKVRGASVVPVAPA